MFLLLFVSDSGRFMICLMYKRLDEFKQLKGT